MGKWGSEEFADEEGYPLTDPGIDAMRHCLWACCISERLSLKFACQITDNHEICNQHNTGEHCKDFYNNRVGATFGQYQPSDCKGYCKQALEDPQGVNGIRLQVKIGCDANSHTLNGVIAAFPNARCDLPFTVPGRGRVCPAVDGPKLEIDNIQKHA